MEELRYSIGRFDLEASVMEDDRARLSSGDHASRMRLRIHRRGRGVNQFEG